MERLPHKTIPRGSLRTPSLGFRIDIRSRRCAIFRLRPLDISTPLKNGAQGRTAPSTAQNEARCPKIPWLLAFVRHVEDGHYWAWKPRSAIFTRSRMPFKQVHRIRRRTRRAMPKTIYAPDSSSLKPGSGATEGVLDYGVSG